MQSFFVILLGVVIAVAGSFYILWTDSGPNPSLARYTVDFDFGEPDVEMELPGSLDEVSGLSYVDDSTVAAVEDERGSIYLVDSRTGTIRSRHKFGPSGDYEGIELVGDIMYVVNSSGDVYSVHDWDTDSPHSTREKTELSSRFDVEGLAYDNVGQRLLLACKEYPGRRLSGYRSVYEYYPLVDSLPSRPLYAINADGKKNDDFPGRLKDFGIKKKDARGFKPSGVAIDPLTQRVFVLSSVFPSIVVVDPDSGVVHVYELERKLFRQPEGIAFDPLGNLYISNEAAGKKPTLLKFDRIHSTDQNSNP